MESSPTLQHTQSGPSHGTDANVDAPNAQPRPQNLHQAIGPNGQSFTMTWQSNGPLPNQQPVRAVPAFPAGFPPPFMNPHMHHAMHAHPVPFRLGTPPAGMPPAGTVRSISPARSRSEGPRQHTGENHFARLQAQQQVLLDTNRMVDLLASGLTANGERRPLTQQETDGLRMRTRVLLREIEFFGQQHETAVNIMAARQPQVLLDPQTAQYQMKYQALHAQAKYLSQRIDLLIQQHGTPSATPSTATPTVPSSTAQGISNTVSDTTPILPATNAAPSPESLTATAPLIPPTSTTTPASSRQPEMFLVFNPAGEPSALVVGPTGRYASPSLPSEILSVLLASQLPHDQLIAAFTQVMRSAVQPGGLLAGANFDTLSNLFPGFESLFTQRNSAEGRSRRAPNGNSHYMNENAGVVGPEGLQVPRSQSAQGSSQQAAARAQNGTGNNPARRDGDAAPDRGAAQAAVNNRQPDEVRDLLAPIIRNVWLVVSTVLFFYLFAGGTRGFWRLLILGGGALIAWSFQAGLIPMRYWNLLRQHWERLTDAQQPPNAEDHRHRDNAEAGQPAPAGAAPGPVPTAQAREPRDPQETANLLLARRQEANRSWITHIASEAYRTAAILVASLVPGIGENLVRENERRQREAREAEERRRREMEEQAKRLNDSSDDSANKGMNEVTANGSPSIAATATGNNTADLGGISRVNKGKGKASEEETAQQEEISVKKSNDDDVTTA